MPFGRGRGRSTCRRPCGAGLVVASAVQGCREGTVPALAQQPRVRVVCGMYAGQWAQAAVPILLVASSNVYLSSEARAGATAVGNSRCYQLLLAYSMQQAARSRAMLG